MGVFASASPGSLDDLLLVDSTPVECGRSRETATRSALGDVAGYGYSASHSRWFWGLRLHLLAAPDGTPRARTLDREFPRDLELHLILDSYQTHKHANVAAWLEKHLRFHLHFTPTSSSWLNLVERWFRELTEKALHRGVFPSVPDLIAAIRAFLEVHNEDPKPFVWTASVEAILEKVGRCKAVLETVH
jgi:transposase